MQRHSVQHDQNGACEHPTAAQPGNGSPSDQHDAVLRCPADCTPDLEEHDAGEEDGLGGEEGVDAAVQQNKTAGREHVSGAVPPDILNAVELVGDGRYRRSQDGPVQRDQEDRYVEREHDQYRLWQGRIHLHIVDS